MLTSLFSRVIHLEFAVLEPSKICYEDLWGEEGTFDKCVQTMAAIFWVLPGNQENPSKAWIINAYRSTYRLSEQVD